MFKPWWQVDNFVLVHIFILHKIFIQAYGYVSKSERKITMISAENEIYSHKNL